MKPTMVNDEVAGETLCSVCGVVVREKEPSTARVVEGRHETFHKHVGNSSSVTEFATTRWVANDATTKCHAELTQILVPMLEHMSVPKMIMNEAKLLIRRMVSDGFAKGKTRLTLCAGIALALCRVHGRIITCKELARLTGTNVKKIRRVSLDIMELYDLQSLSIEDRTRRILSRMCTDIGRPDLLRPALGTYNSVLLSGYPTGKNPCVVAAHALGIHAGSVMSKKQFAETVGVQRQSLHRYVTGYGNVC